MTINASTSCAKRRCEAGTKAGPQGTSWVECFVGSQSGASHRCNSNITVPTYLVYSVYKDVCLLALRARRQSLLRGSIWPGVMWLPRVPIPCRRSLGRPISACSTVKWISSRISETVKDNDIIDTLTNHSTENI